MSYGNPVNTNRWAADNVPHNKRVNLYPGGSQTTSVDLIGPFPYQLVETRTGTNSTGDSIPLEKPHPRFVQVTKYVRKKVPKKPVYKLKTVRTKLGFKTEKILVKNPRPKRARKALVGPPRPKVFNPLNYDSYKVIQMRDSHQQYMKVYRDPNPLSYTTYVLPSNFRSISAVRLVQNGPVIDVYKYTYSGSLWHNFRAVPVSTLMGVHAQNYTHAESTRFVAVKNQLQNELLAKATDWFATVEAGLAQMFAERAQTWKLYRDSIYRLVTTARHVRKGNLAAARRTLLPKGSKDLANDRLAYSYGVKPLIGDIQDIAKMMTQAPVVYETFRRSKRVDMPRELIQTTSALGCTTKVYESGVVELKYKIIAEMRRPGAEFHRFGVLPLSLMWELTPWSFVIDKFLPVTDALRQVESSLTVIPKKIIRTTVYRRKIEIVLKVSGTHHTSYIWNATTLTYYINSMSVKREILSSLPSIDICTPVRSPLSDDFLLNAAALLRQFIRK